MLSQWGINAMKMWIVDLDNSTKYIRQYLLEERKLFQLSNSCNHDYELNISISIVIDN